MNEFNKLIGRNISNYRKSKNISTTTLSELSGVPQSTISRLENGQASFNVETLINLCEALKVTLYDVLPTTVFPEIKVNTPYKQQLIQALEQMSEEEIKLILSIFNSVTPLVKVIEYLSEKDKKRLKDILNSLPNNQ